MDDSEQPQVPAQPDAAPPAPTHARGGRRHRAVADVPAAPAIRPGMAGGQYRPLAVRDIERIFSTALDVLENIGIGESIPEILRYALPGGCTLGTDGRLRFPRSLVEDMMAVASHGFVRYGVDPAYDIEISGER